MIKIIAVGKKLTPWVETGSETFCKRLHKPFDVQWVHLPYSAHQSAQARQEESRSILSKLNSTDYVILLDERGQQLTSPALSAKLTELFASGRSVVLVIGGAYGVTDDLRQRADFIWSLSALVFPHQLIRIMLTEQIYRAQAIAQNHPYHHS